MTGSEGRGQALTKRESMPSQHPPALGVFLQVLRDGAKLATPAVRSASWEWRMLAEARALGWGTHQVT